MSQSIFQKAKSSGDWSLQGTLRELLNGMPCSKVRASKNGSGRYIFFKSPDGDTCSMRASNAFEEGTDPREYPVYLTEDNEFILCTKEGESSEIDWLS